MAGEEKLLNEFKQDLLGFTSKLSKALESQPEKLKEMFARYEQLYRSTYDQVATLKEKTKLETKAAMKSGVINPSPFDSVIAKQLEKDINKETQKNTQKDPELDSTPRKRGPGQS